MIIVTNKEYNKETYGLGNGYDKRSVAIPQSIIIHTTNGKVGTSFESEVLYIARSPDIGAHFVVSKDGRIVQTLNPLLRAWHAGVVEPSVFSNNTSIGIECHWTPAEGTQWPLVMRTALTDICTYLITKYAITNPAYVDTHRKVARPIGRKIDPSGFADAQFYPWRDSLFAKSATVPVQDPTLQSYTVLYNGVRVRSQPTTDASIVGMVSKDIHFTGVANIPDTKNMVIDGITTWVQIKGNVPPSLVNGFIHGSLVQSISSI